MKIVSQILFLILLLVTGSVFAGDVLVVNGLNNQSVDRANIQTAIDNAKPSTVILLNGTFQLDGTTIDVNKSNLTLRGAGASGGWSTVLVGLSVSGVPRGDFGAPTFENFNRAIKISNDAQNISIEGIRFVDINRGITLAPQLSGNADLCSALSVSKGGSNYTIANNLFENNLRPINVNAEASGVSVLNNKFLGSRTRDISMGGGGSLRCTLPNGSGGFTTQVINGAGIPKNVTVANNIIDLDKAAFPVVFLNVINTVCDSNQMTGGPNLVGMVTVRGDHVTVSNNVIDMSGAGYFGIAVDPPVAPTEFNNYKSLIVGNTVKNSIDDIGVGIAVDSASGMTAKDNHFSNISGPDYLVCDANADTNHVSQTLCDGLGISSTDNTFIINDPSVTIMDLGINTRIIYK